MVVIAVSDVHLDIEESEKDRFNEFLEYLLESGEDYELEVGKRDAFVLNGDILDLWRRDCVGCPSRNSETIEKIKALNEKMEVHYVLGNHDQHYGVGIEPQKGGIRHEKEVILEIDGTKIQFIHGHQFDPLQNEVFSEILTHSSDYSGKYADEAWKIIREGEGFFERCIDKFKDLFTKERSWRKEVSQGMDKATTVIEPGEAGLIDRKAKETLYKTDKRVIGHTHDEFVSEDNKIANTGAWVKKEGVYNTLVRVDQDAVLRLLRYNGWDDFEEIPKVYSF
ncbi:MAG: metallophosphoesterase family protein [Euryarchaeota archaeon]|nr:metallophosphoesterase family protein [Euryarchaeota archaeon]